MSLKTYLIIAALVGGFLLFGAYSWKVYSAGYGACDLKHERAQKEADIRAKSQQEKIRKNYQEVEDELRKKQGADAPASDYLRSVLERLRD